MFWLCINIIFAEVPKIERMIYSHPLMKSPLAIADAYLESKLQHSIDEYTKKTIHSHTESTIIQYRFQHDGIPLWNERISIIVDKQSRVLARSGIVSDSFWALSPNFDLSFEDGLVLGMSQFLGLSPKELQCNLSEGNLLEQKFSCSEEHTLWRSQPRIMKILWQKEDSIHSAYRLELIGTRNHVQFAQELVVDAGTGVLISSSSIRNDAQDYLVWADEEGFYPTPFGAVEGVDFTAQRWNSGDWMIQDGSTKSNHVHAYTDRYEPDGFSSGDQFSFAPFDSEFTPLLQAYENNEQIETSLNQLFYSINTLHDIFYEAGFDEASGVALMQNGGSEGDDGDPLLAESQDFSGYNNANMMTPADGESPVMQLYLWTTGGASLIVQSPVMNPNTFTLGMSDFGRFEDMEGSLIPINDENGNPRDGCSPFTVGANIALVERGVCTFVEKAQFALEGGATGIIIYNGPNEPPNDVIPITGEGFVDIPVYSLSRNAANQLLNLSTTPYVSVQIDIFRDSSMDGQIIAHEWSHYMFARLTPGGYNNQYNAINEGTSDFVSLLSTTRFSQIDLHGGFPVGGFSDSDMVRGIRRAPYSTDSALYPMTFRHIQDGIPLPSFVMDSGYPNSQSHQAGEIWCNALWKILVLLIEEHGFEEGPSRMREYVVMGLKLFPSDASFLDARDAFLAASSIDALDYLLFWEGFASMGMGIDAQVGTREEEEQGNLGIQESFSKGGHWKGASLSLLDDGKSCDDDGILDFGEIGTIRISGQNLGGERLEEAQEIVAYDANGNVFEGFSFPEGTVFSVGLDVLEEGTFSLPVVLLEETNGPFLLQVGNQQIRIDTHIDVHAQKQFVEGFTHDDNVWTWECSPDCSAWKRDTEFPLDPVMWGSDLGIGSDSALVSPYLLVSSDQELTMSWQHRYQFEKTEGVAYDGGVVEVSIHDGPWEDLNDYVQMPYTDRITILNQAPDVPEWYNAPIANRMAFSGKSPLYPEYQTVGLVFGRIWAGQRIRIRFRIGTDIAVSSPGWHIDTILFTGIEEAPFTGFAPNQDDCVYPIADAGIDQELSDVWRVQLDGADSYDPDGGDVRYSWSQVSGPDIMLHNPISAQPFFFPARAGNYQFQLEVQNPQGLSAQDMVRIVIKKENTAAVSIEGGCSHSHTSVAPWMLLLLCGMGIQLRRRTS